VQDYEGNVDAAVISHPAYPAGGLRETSTIKQNRSGGSVNGWELAALHHMDYLPGILSGLGVQANYTYATSKDDGADPINQPGIVDPGSALEGFAKQSYNLTAFYEYENLQARLAYNWRDRFMHARDGGADTIAATLPVHTEAYGQLDMSLSYDLNEMFTLSLEAINLLNERRLEFVDVRNRVSLVQYTGARYQLGLRATF
jgi:iron complex outermembrane recepter protein